MVTDPKSYKNPALAVQWTFVFHKTLIWVTVNDDQQLDYQKNPLDDQQDATILAYLFIPNQLYTFRAIPVDNIRCCKYSQMLLMMGEDIARNA